MIDLLAATISKTHEKQKFTKELLNLTIKMYDIVRWNLEHIKEDFLKTFEKYQVSKKKILVDSVDDMALKMSWRNQDVDDIEYFLDVSMYILIQQN